MNLCDVAHISISPTNYYIVYSSCELIKIEIFYLCGITYHFQHDAPTQFLIQIFFTSSMKIVLIYAALPRAHPQIFHSHLIMKHFYCDEMMLLLLITPKKNVKLLFKKNFQPSLNWDFFLLSQRSHLFDIF